MHNSTEIVKLVAPDILGCASSSLLESMAIEIEKNVLRILLYSFPLQKKHGCIEVDRRGVLG